MDFIYLDSASSAPIWPEIIKQEKAFNNFANPGSKHRLGVKAREIWQNALKELASNLGCQANQLILTSGATESINHVFFGSELKTGDEIIISAVEHSAVYETARAIARQKQLVLHLAPVKTNGQVNLEEFEKLLSKKTRLVSIIAANNEFGSVAKLNRLIKTVRKFEKQSLQKILFHTDASQLLPWNKISLGSLNVDLLSFSGAKLGAGIGSGGLFVREPQILRPLIFGGGQQHQLRSGTENIRAATNLAAALELCWSANTLKINTLRIELTKELIKIPSIQINGDPKKTLPNIISLTTPVDADRLVYALDQDGFAIAAGATCSISKSADRTRVLEQIGLTNKEALNTVRISLGHQSTKKDIKLFAKALTEAVAHLGKSTSTIEQIKKVGQKLNKKYASE